MATQQVGAQQGERVPQDQAAKEHGQGHREGKARGLQPGEGLERCRRVWGAGGRRAREGAQWGYGDRWGLHWSAPEARGLKVRACGDGVLGGAGPLIPPVSPC